MRQTPRHARRALRRDGPRADVGVAARHEPAKPHLQRRHLAAKLMPVQRERCLQPQRVTGAEPGRFQAGGGARLQQRRPQRLRALGGGEQLEPVLARVAGARHQRRGAGHLGLPAAIGANGGEVGRGHALQDPFRAWPLDGDQSYLGAPVAQVDAVHAGGDRARVLDDHVGVGGVDHDAVPVAADAAAKAVDDHVVDDPARLIEDERVARPAHRQPVEVQAGQPLDAGGGPGAGNVDLPHVADVEQAGRRAHGAVLGDDARVLHRHAPAREGDHARAEPFVGGMQRGAAQRWHRKRTITAPGQLLQTAPHGYQVVVDRC